MVSYDETRGSEHGVGGAMTSEVTDFLSGAAIVLAIIAGVYGVPLYAIFFALCAYLFILLQVYFEFPEYRKS